MALTLLRHSALQKNHLDRYIRMTDLHIDPKLFNAQKVTLLMLQKFDFIYSSDLVRCQQTLDMMGIKEYLIHDYLREVRFNEGVDGVALNKIKNLDSYKSYYVEEQASWHTHLRDESPEDFTTRIHAFLEALPRDKEILVCSHTGTLKKILSLLGYSKNKIAYLEYIRIDNVI